MTSHPSHSPQAPDPEPSPIDHKLPHSPEPSADHPLDPADADSDHYDELDNADIDLAAWGLSDSTDHQDQRSTIGATGTYNPSSHDDRQRDSPPNHTSPPHRQPRQNSWPNRFDYSQEDIKALRNALQDNNPLRLAFYFLDYILRAQTALFEQIYRQQQLPQIITAMVILTTLLSAIYGLTMGMNHSLLQSVVAAIKLPILFMLTAIICIPSLYTFNVLLGQRFKFFQTVTLMVMTLGTTCILLASLAPIAFFFSLTTQHYPFLLLLHVAIFGLCGVYGVQYLYRGCIYLAFRMEQPLNNLLLRVWIVIYSLVGMQLGWRLRPFIGSEDSPFQIVRPDQGGNFYTAVWDSLLALFGGN
ncbi:MAG: hypothetical protein VKJ64_12135 [Leptolyngbyaceae bacterium]|nr:hypothetical protein [Leptolyngbyaceae bacterium]